MNYYGIKNKVNKQSQTNDSPVFCVFHPQQINSPLYICLSENCEISNQHADGSRIFCGDCLDEQKHSGHFIYNFTKFKEISKQFSNASSQKCKSIIQKLSEFRKDVNQLLDKIQAKIINVLTSANQQQQQKKNRKLSQQIANSIKQLKINSNIHEWNNILRAKRDQKDINQAINEVLVFKEEVICEQIQNISDLLNDSIKQSLANIQFITMNKKLLFNPEDMHDFGVGLSLNRNILQAVQAQGKQIIHSMNKQQSASTVALTGCKLAFTEIPFLGEIAKSFMIQKIQTKIMIGCTDERSHKIISEKFFYQNCERFIYGISISPEGQVIAYCKNNAPRVIPQIKIVKDDIIEMSIHPKQNSLIFLKYQRVDAEKQRHISQIGNKMASVYSSMLGDIHKSHITTIDLEPDLQNPTFYSFAGVAREGDQVKIVQNVILLKRQLKLKASRTQHSIFIDEEQGKELLALLNGEKTEEKQIEEN